MKIARAALAALVCVTAVPAALAVLLARWTRHLPGIQATMHLPVTELNRAVNLALPCAVVAVLAGVLLLRVVPAGLVTLAGSVALSGEFLWMGQVDSLGALRWASAFGGVGAGLALAGAGGVLRAVDPVLSSGWAGLLGGGLVAMAVWVTRADLTWTDWRSVIRPAPWGLLAAAVAASAGFALVDWRGRRGGPVDPLVAWGIPVAAVLAALSVSLYSSQDTSSVLVTAIAVLAGLLVAAIAAHSAAPLAGLAVGVLVPGVAETFQLSLPGRDGLGGAWSVVLPIMLAAAAAGVGAGLAVAGLRLAYPPVVTLVGLGALAAGLALLLPLWHRYGSLPGYLLVAGGAGVALAGSFGRRPGLGLGMVLAGWVGGQLLAGSVYLWRGHIASRALASPRGLSAADQVALQRRILNDYVRTADRWTLGTALGVIVLVGLVVLAGVVGRRTKS